LAPARNRSSTAQHRLRQLVSRRCQLVWHQRV
jgi:hypothetical protein